jgi:hypothetical protein
LCSKLRFFRFRNKIIIEIKSLEEKDKEISIKNPNSSIKQINNQLNKEENSNLIFKKDKKNSKIKSKEPIQKSNTENILEIKSRKCFSLIKGFDENENQNKKNSSNDDFEFNKKIENKSVLKIMTRKCITNKSEIPQKFFLNEIIKEERKEEKEIEIDIEIQEIFNKEKNYENMKDTKKENNKENAEEYFKETYKKNDTEKDEKINKEKKNNNNNENNLAEKINLLKKEEKNNNYFISLPNKDKNFSGNFIDELNFARYDLKAFSKIYEQLLEKIYIENRQYYITLYDDIDYPLKYGASSIMESSKFFKNNLNKKLENIELIEELKVPFPEDNIKNSREIGEFFTKTVKEITLKTKGRYIF